MKDVIIEVLVLCAILGALFGGLYLLLEMSCTTEVISEDDDTIYYKTTTITGNEEDKIAEIISKGGVIDNISSNNYHCFIYWHIEKSGNEKV